MSLTCWWGLIKTQISMAIYPILYIFYPIRYLDQLTKWNCHAESRLRIKSRPIKAPFTLQLKGWLCWLSFFKFKINSHKTPSAVYLWRNGGVFPNTNLTVLLNLCTGCLSHCLMFLWSRGCRFYKGIKIPWTSDWIKSLKLVKSNFVSRPKSNTREQCANLEAVAGGLWWVDDEVA